MTISANVRKELFEMTSNEGKLIRIKPTEAKAGTTVYSSKQSQPLKMWTQEEHEKFLEAMEKYPSGPWKVIASFIGTKTTRQTMTHAQKYRQKISRWRRGLRHKGRKQAGEAGDVPMSGCEGDYSAKENLFKAIEYVSGDDMGQYSESGSPTQSRYGGDSEDRSELFKLAELASIEVMKQESPSSMSPSNNHEDVEMSSPSDRKQREHEMTAPWTPPRAVKTEKGLKMDWQNRPSREFCTRMTEIKLSPLRGADGRRGGSVDQRVLSALTGLHHMNAQHLRNDNGYLARPDLRQSLSSTCGLPSNYARGSVLCKPEFPEDDDRAMLMMQMGGGGSFHLPPLNMSGQGGTFSIPPLRSKIDPSVLNH